MRVRRAGLVVAVMLLAGIVHLGTSPVALAVAPGGVIAWGNNGAGQLGDGAAAGPENCGTVGPCSTTPVAASGLSTVIAVAGGAYHSLAVLSNGTVTAWGDNSYGQIGDGTTTQRYSPVAVSGVSGATAIAAGADHSLAVLSNGSVMAWGLNSNGELGDGTTTNRDAPVAVGGLSGAIAIAAGADHSLALLSNGKVMAWGANGGGQLGDGTTTDRHTPVAVSSLSGVTAIAAGNGHSLALLSNGTVMAWGGNSQGELGDGTTTDRHTPVAVSGVSGVTAIAAGRDHSLALLSNGTVMAWGENSSGELGDGTTTQRHTPVAVSGVSGVTAIAAGAVHSLALLSNGTVMTWGYNGYGQLGDGTTTERHTPVPVSGLSGVGALAPEQQASHTLVIEEGAFASLSAASLSFGSQPVGSTSAPQTLTLTNSGPKSLTVSGDTLSGTGAAAFSKITDACHGATLPSGASCQVSLSFAPRAPGAAVTMLALTSNAAYMLAPVMLSGTGLVPPAIVSPPAISGQAIVDQTLTEVRGSWSNNATGYADQWLRCDSTGNACAAIAGATGPSYTLTAGDIGSTIRVQETANNTAGASSPATSTQTALVKAASSSGGGGSGGGGSGGGSGSGGPPNVTGYRLTNNPFVVAAAPTPLLASTAARKHKQGTTFKFTLSEAATVKIVISQRFPGRRHGKSCLTATKHRRHAKRCTRIVSHGTLTRTNHTGANRVSFSGRIGSRALKPGNYQATLTATDSASDSSKPQTISFTIVRR